MFIQVFNWVLATIGSLFTFALFTDLGGINLATIFAGMIITTVALKILFSLLEIPYFTSVAEQGYKTDKHNTFLQQKRSTEIAKNAKKIESSLGKARGEK